MNTLSKRLLTGTLAVGVTLGLGVGVEESLHHEAHAATQPYYNYHGYAGNDTSSVLSNQFKEAVKSNNVTFNGKKIVQTKGNGEVNIYDQTFSGVTKSGKSASGVSINVKDNLSYSDIKKSYGNTLIRMDPYQTSAKEKSVLSYKPTNQGPGVIFSIKNNKVTNINITHSGIGF